MNQHRCNCISRCIPTGSTDIEVADTNPDYSGYCSNRSGFRNIEYIRNHLKHWRVVIKVRYQDCYVCSCFMHSVSHNNLYKKWEMFLSNSKYLNNMLYIINIIILSRYSLLNLEPKLYAYSQCRHTNRPPFLHVLTCFQLRLFFERPPVTLIFCLNFSTHRRRQKETCVEISAFFVNKQVRWIYIPRRSDQLVNSLF